jgi:phosphatidylethanolamine-binding protein (PEBP) family uncharacterized protein
MKKTDNTYRYGFGIVTIKIRVSALIIFLVILGCSEDYSNLPQISVDFKWLTDQICFDKRSPEITLENVPDNTRLFKVKMVDIDNRYGHGGGTFEHDGSNLIPVGALKNYEGPCPPSTMNPRYEIRVKAIDEGGNVIAFGKKFKKYPPEPEESDN